MSTHSRRGITRWPEAVEEHYLQVGVWEEQTIQSFIREAAGRVPDKEAYCDASNNVRFTYRELVEHADHAAAGFLRLGLVPDDRVILALPNGWRFVLVLLGCLRAGIIPVMALPAHRHHELSAIGEKAEARAIFCADESRGFDYQELAGELKESVPGLEWAFIAGDAHAPNISLDDLLLHEKASLDEVAQLDERETGGTDPALFLLSGGTTGVPKIITRTHNDYVYNIKACAEVAGLSEESVYLATMPVAHNFPLGCPGILGALFVGARAVTLGSPAPEKAFPVIDAEKVTITAAVPAVAQRWIEYEEDNATGLLSSLEVLQVGGSRMPDTLSARVGPVLGCTLQQVFGMAEGLINMTRLDDPAEIITTTQGRPVSEYDEIRIVDESFQDVAVGQRGEILTRGPYTPQGYYASPEANEKSFQPGGWYHPGDVVELGPGGNLIVHGRNKDIINRGGEKISAEEIESLVYQLSQVKLAAVVAMPDTDYGERICLYAVVGEGQTLTLEEVREHLLNIGVAGFKLPERLVLSDGLPMTKIGKVDKKELRNDIAARLEAEQ
ncbi:AMP-binding protein [Corynebacterium sp. YIM 101645]|uniref:AMP-binding protein n=1 Tax=Corynebacterium lemuris TaxID=1859292 RepID=A0ABT2G093_9CORY|nr:AMP-binding protein [Corynebacterium lemuris]MCS5480699.1 AMP-binding protein [Corynebacterium lemuris]